MSNLISEGSVGLFKLGTSGFAVMKSNLEIVAFNSACIKLSIKISNSGIEIGILISEVGISSLQLSTSGLTSS